MRLTVLYYARVATVLLTGAGVAILIGAALLLPSYFFIHAEADQASAYVETAGSIADQHAKGAAQDTLAQFNEAIRLLSGADRNPVFAHLMTLITESLPRGVGVSTVSVVYDDSGNATIAVSGTAGTRAELLAYSDALKKVGELKNVTVPVSDLVADVDGSFSLTATWDRPRKP